MKPKLILHAGTHKTGTTAVQAFAAEHRAALAARGILYPDLAPLGIAHAYPQHRFAHALAGADKTLGPADAVRLAALWAEAAAARGAVVFVSAEPLYRYALTEPGGDWRAGRARYLDRLAAALAPFEVEAALVFRRPDDFVRSLFQENVSRARTPKWARFPAFRAHAVGGALRYADNAALFAERFARLRGLVYEDLPGGAGFAPAVLKALGLDAAGLAPVGVVRESFSPAQTHAKLALHRIVGDGASKAALQGFLRRPEVTALLAEHLGPGPFDLWENAAARDDFLEAEAPGNRTAARGGVSRARDAVPAAARPRPAGSRLRRGAGGAARRDGDRDRDDPRAGRRRAGGARPTRPFPRESRGAAARRPAADPRLRRDRRRDEGGHDEPLPLSRRASADRRLPQEGARLLRRAAASQARRGAVFRALARLRPEPSPLRARGLAELFEVSALRPGPVAHGAIHRRAGRAVQADLHPARPDRADRVACRAQHRAPPGAAPGRAVRGRGRGLELRAPARPVPAALRPRGPAGAEPRRAAATIPGRWSRAPSAFSASRRRPISRSAPPPTRAATPTAAPSSVSTPASARRCARTCAPT